MVLHRWDSALRAGGGTSPSRTLPLLDAFLFVTPFFKILCTPLACPQCGILWYIIRL